MKWNEMKNKNFYLLKRIHLFSSLLILLFSCQKDEDIVSNTDDINSTEISAYYIDDVEVSSEDFTNITSDMFLVEVHKPSNGLKSSKGSNSEQIEKRAYSSEEKYIEFGNEHGYEFDKQIVFEKIMSNYAENSGAIIEYENTGIKPVWYLEREQFVYDSLFSNTSQLKSTASLVVTLFEHHFVQGSGAGASIVMGGTYPVMPPGWNNRVSCVEFIGIGGGVHIYDRTFYRNKVETVVNWGMTHINFPSSLNDKMSSGVRFL